MPGEFFKVNKINDLREQTVEVEGYTQNIIQGAGKGCGSQRVTMKSPSVVSSYIMGEPLSNRTQNVRTLSTLALLLTLALPALQSHAASQSELLSERVAAVLPEGLSIKSISRDAESGFYQIELSNDSFLYAINADGYLVHGELFGMQAGRLINLTEQKSRAPRRASSIQAIDTRDMIVFAPKTETKAQLTVFTDVDCGYCRKLHREIDQLNDLGIEVRYLAFPRAGPDSESARKMTSAWCADDRQKAITRLKLGQSIRSRQCRNPIVSQYNLGRDMGITGTPTLISSDGATLPGYLKPEKIARWLGI